MARPKGDGQYYLLHALYLQGGTGSFTVYARKRRVPGHHGCLGSGRYCRISLMNSPFKLQYSSESVTPLAMISRFRATYAFSK